MHQHGTTRLHQSIPHHVRQLLAELELISHGSTQSWNTSGGAYGESTAVLPYGESNPPHLYLRQAYAAQVTDHGRTQIVVQIHAELAAAKGNVDRSHVIGETRDQEDARIIHQGEGFTAQEVANRFHCTPSRVRRARLAAGRRQDNGQQINHTNTPDLAAQDGRIEALRMKEQGMSIRQIAMVLAQPKSTVQDWVRAA